ncbi:MAG TPA: bifunctional histidinol-phosphatase/imidazoleglycerol-phosphate dehydratase [Sutterella sp.]|nr:bifunctional histidinol-phosphatase/imidazoleglycerol-phosphate dehydratase [Sutterella sp.]
MAPKYLFIDRDGTLIDEPKDTFQVDSYERLRFEAGVIGALKSLAHAGFHLVMVTNQDYLGTEKLPLEAFEGPHRLMLDVFASEGVTFDEVLICPHGPDEGCACRKPKTGLVTKYLAPGAIDKSASYVIGDRETDLQLAQNMGITGIRYNRENNPWEAIAKCLTKPDRHAHVSRKTKETDIDVEVFLDRSDASNISTGIGFFDHMLTQIATHAGITLLIQAKGDIEVDDHHTVEDVGLALGAAFKEALGDKRGITRFGFVLPMDECLAQVALDISGRPYCTFSAPFTFPKVGEMSTQNVEHFFRSLAFSMGLTLNMEVTKGNDHHMAEALFKAFARALKQAIAVTGDALPSSKGVIA